MTGRRVARAVNALATIAGMFIAGCGGGTTTNITIVAPSPGARASVPGVYRVPTGSMEPTLAAGQRVIVLGLSSSPVVGGIVLFHPPVNAAQEVCGVVRPPGAACSQAESHSSDVLFIKRVVAGPGDVISIIEGHVMRNGKREADSYIRPCEHPAGCNFPTPITIPAGDWFVMGDNRGESDDSRFWGPVPTAWIVGAAGATISTHRLE